MNLAHASASHDTSADLAWLLHEGYQVTFTALSGVGYLVTVISPFGSQGRGAGETPGAALRSMWPFEGTSPDPYGTSPDPDALDGQDATPAGSNRKGDPG